MSATCTYYVGDSLTVLRTLPDASADLVLSSPPFMALRAYLPPDHPDKTKEMGSEATPGEFIDALLDVVEELDRVLAPHGTLAFELGDTYAGSGGAGGDYAAGGMRDGQARFDGSASKAYGLGSAPRPARVGRGGRDRRADEAAGVRPHQNGWRADRPGWPLDKSLCLIPELFRFALAYGLNPLTGRQTPRWRVRNVVRWCRPNPPVGALGDKFRPATSDLVVACKSRTRYFDLDAVRTLSERLAHTDNRGGHVRDGIGGRTRQVMNPVDENGHRIQSNPAGAPPLDWWSIPTKGYTGSHHATWPPALLTRPVLAMCPERVCMVCGEPSRRIVETTNAVAGLTDRHGEKTRRANADETNAWRAATGATSSSNSTLGWTDCGHDSWRPGVVLDPFGGSGTTGLVATGHGRSAVLIDIDERNLHLARERIGMFLTEAPS